MCSVSVIIVERKKMSDHRLIRKNHTNETSRVSKFATPASLPAKLAHNFWFSDHSLAAPERFYYKFRNEISYSLCDPFIRHSNDVFLRSRVVPARKHVNTHDVSSRAAHRPFRLTTRTSRSSSYILHERATALRPRFLAGFTSGSEDARFYDVQLYERLSEIFYPP